MNCLATAKLTFAKTILLAILLSAFGTVVAQNSYTVPSSGQTNVSVTPSNCITVLDPGGNNSYSNNCNGRLRVSSSSNHPIRISGTYNTETNYDKIRIYRGNSTNSADLIGEYSGSGNIDMICMSTSVTIQFSSDGTITRDGFELSICTCNGNAAWVQNVQTSENDNGVTITWNDNGSTTSWTVKYGTSPTNLVHTATTTTPSITLTSLTSNTQFYFRVLNNASNNTFCGSEIYTFTTQCHEVQGGCIDYTNFNSCLVEARYGTFNDPDMNIGFVDQGSSSISSRHTVHTNQNEYDSRTGGQLKTVPPGFSASVRLGNWQTGSQAESIKYRYTVDTLVSDLLIMKYASVLQNPNHNYTDQPRFKFQILDINGNEINSNCYSADFVASSALGWNSYSGALWKDWTTVGVDLTSLHGQTIFIKLTTFDCSHSGHYGYAYFVFDCGFKALASTNCGNVVENTFTAPSGFAYRWYNANSPNTTIATTQSLHVSQAGDYRCDLQFIGAPTGANCSFTLSAIAGERYPVAQYSYEIEDTVNCQTTIRFHNNSVISRFADHSQLTTLPCEGAEWIIDGISVSTANHPSVLFDPGAHSVRLIASLSNGMCTDTVDGQILVGAPCLVTDTIYDTVCQGFAYQFFDTTIYDAGEYLHEELTLHRTLFLTVNPTTYKTIDTAVTQNSLPYTAGGESFNAAVSGNTITLSNSTGCDSIITLTLNIWWNDTVYLDSNLCENRLPLTWNDKTFNLSTTNPATVQTSTQSTTLSGIHGEDSLVVMSVTMRRNTGLTRNDTIVENNLPVTVGGITFHDSHSDTVWTITNANGCDSIISYSLLVWHNVEALADSTICENALPLTWNGATFADEGTQEAILASAGSHGEDSTVTMTLHVLRNSSLTHGDTVVENELPVTIGGITFGGSQTDTMWIIPNAAGCDSVIYYSLYVWGNYSHSFDSTVCDDMLPLHWCDTTFYESGEITLQYESKHGADSIVLLTLNVNPTYSIHDTSVICQGETARYGYTTSGDYDIAFTTVNGCDSVIHLNVVVNPVYDLYFSDTICDNETATFDGESIATAGEHYFSHSTVHGCDSLLTLTLTVFPTNHTFQSEKICDGRPFTWIDGNTYNVSPTDEPTMLYTNRYGCDSTHHLILKIDSTFKAAMKYTPEIVNLNKRDVRLNDVSPSLRREWYFGEWSDTSRICVFSFPADEDSLEILLVAASAIGCIDTARGMVRNDRSIVWPPNAFTPDEQSNNRFFLSSFDIISGEVYIYSREGTFITSFDVLTGSWNGKYKGKDCPQGTYVWTLRYISRANPRMEQKATGTVTLLR
ncbi:MAG: gliding motility-associated C-terminal domain-containing protein [Bacteroidales bacterium]|nr:gliding motility-associated C-terminal domain-containing protein [Bacteroidales bacterium]